MIRYIIRRLLLCVVVLFIVSIVTFMIFFLVPKATGEDPGVPFCGRTCDAATLKATDIKLGLDKPLLYQYEQYVKAIFVGRTFSDGTHCPAPCLGFSFHNNQPVWQEITAALPVTASLAVGAAVLWLVSGCTVGIISALKRRTWIDRVSMGIALAGVSLPIYFTGLILLELFDYRWGLLTSTYVPFTQNPLEWAKGLILPWVALAFLYAALYARLMRASMLETMSEDYIRTARAKGLAERTVISKHGLRAALTPIVTIFGLDLGALLGGAILTEYTFNLAGVGKLAVDAISQQDLPVIIGVTLFGAFFIVIANLVVDVLYAVVDPRVRYS